MNTKSEVPAGSGSLDPLLAISERLRTQDNRCTAEPMFCVQGRRRIYGMDPQWMDDPIWIDTSNGAEEVEPPEDEENPPEGYEKTGYVDVWETLAVCFTESGCKEHLHLNGHNYRRYKEVRIYAESFRRNPEMQAIREFLLANAELSDGLGGHSLQRRVSTLGNDSMKTK